MKKRIMKKIIKNMSDNDLYEHIAYIEKNRFRYLIEKEFDERFKEEFKQQEKMAEELMHISHEVDELMKII